MKITLIDPVDDGEMAKMEVVLRGVKTTFSILPSHLKKLHDLVSAIMRLSDRVEEATEEASDVSE